MTPPFVMRIYHGLSLPVLGLPGGSSYRALSSNPAQTPEANRRCNPFTIPVQGHSEPQRHLEGNRGHEAEFRLRP